MRVVRAHCATPWFGTRTSSRTHRPRTAPVKLLSESRLGFSQEIPLRSESIGGLLSGLCGFVEESVIHQR